MLKKSSGSNLPDRWGSFDGLKRLAASELQDGIFTVTLEGGRFDCLLMRKNLPRLFVLLSGAHDKERYPLPQFDRWSWAKQFPGSVLCVSDPTLYLAPDRLRIGWYVGTREQDWTGALANLVRHVAARLNVPVNSIISYGSSAGGFASLMLAIRLGPATAVAINPQIEIFAYSKRFVDEFLSVAFGGQERGEIDVENVRRFSVTTAFAHAPLTKCLIVQNIQDVSHYKRHFSAFCKAYQINPAEAQTDNGRVVTMTYDSPSGHGAEPRELAPQIIESATQLAERTVEKPTLERLQFRQGTDIGEPIRSGQLYLQVQDAQCMIDDDRVVFAPFGRRDVAAIDMTFPFDWSRNPYKDNNWCAQLQKWNMVDAYILAYEQKRNAQYLDIAKRIMLDWYRHHVLERRESHMMWRDFIVGIRSMKIAFLISCWQHGALRLTEAERTVFLHLVQIHLEFVLEISNIKFTNHTFSDFHGAMALVQVIDPVNGAAVESFILGLTPRLIGSQFDRHGVHLEHSFGYQGFGIRCLQRLVASGWFERVDIKGWMDRAEAIEPWLRLPDGRMAPVGDTDGKLAPLKRTETAFRGERQVFNQSGYCIIRSDGKQRLVAASYFCLIGAFHSRVHKQPDDLSVIWFEGEDILCDAGKFAYKSHKYRKYVQSTRAHNTVEIDDADYSVENEDAYGSAIRSVTETPRGFLVTASVRHKKFGVRHSRHCLYEPGKWLLIVDRLQSASKHDFTQWFHFSPHLSLNAAKHGFVTKLSASGRILAMLFETSQPSQVQLVSGQNKPVIQGWISQGYAEVSPNPTIGITQQGEDLTFATFFCIDDNGSRLSVAKNGQLILDIRHAEHSEKFEIVAGLTQFRMKESKEIRPRVVTPVPRLDATEQGQLPAPEGLLPRDVLLLARRHTKHGQYDEAIHVLQGGSGGSAGSVTALAELAEVEMARRNWAHAEHYLQQAVALPSGIRNERVVRKLAFVLRRLNRREESDTVLQRGGIIDPPAHVRTFDMGDEHLSLEIYPVLVNGEATVFLDHHVSTDTVLVRSRAGLFVSRNGTITWHRLPIDMHAGVTSAHIVDERHILLYNSHRRELDLYNIDGEKLSTHSAPYPWHGTWGIGQSGRTVVYAEYDIHSKYQKDEKSLPIRRVFRSVDGGRQWDEVLAARSAKGANQKIRHFHTVQPDPYQPGTWYLSSGDAVGQCRVWCSEDDGKSWRDITPSDAGIHPQVFRFTALQFSDSHIFWGTDDLLNGDQAYAVRASKSEPLKVELLGPIGKDKSRAIVANDFGYLTISQGKEATPAPQVFLCLVTRNGNIVGTDPVPCERPTSVTYSCASRRAVNGRFFTRGQKGSLGNSTEAYLWKFNRKVLLNASRQCNLCSDVLEQAVADGMNHAITETTDRKLWNALQFKTNEAHCPTCFSPARLRTLAAVFSQVVKNSPLGGPALLVSAAQKEWDIISRHFSPLTNVTLYGKERYPNSMGGIDITSMPGIGTSTFAIAYAMSVLDYIPNLDDVFSEMWRVLKPGGILLFMIQPWRLVEGESPPVLLHRNALSGTNRYHRTDTGETGIPHCRFSTGWIANELKRTGFEAQIIDKQDSFSDIRHCWYVCRKSR